MQLTFASARLIILSIQYFYFISFIYKYYSFTTRWVHNKFYYCQWKYCKLNLKFTSTIFLFLILILNSVYVRYDFIYIIYIDTLLISNYHYYNLIFLVLVKTQCKKIIALFYPYSVHYLLKSCKSASSIFSWINYSRVQYTPTLLTTNKFCSIIRI